MKESTIKLRAGITHQYMGNMLHHPIASHHSDHWGNQLVGRGLLGGQRAGCIIGEIAKLWQGHRRLAVYYAWRASKSRGQLREVALTASKHYEKLARAIEALEA